MLLRFPKPPPILELLLLIVLCLLSVPLSLALVWIVAVCADQIKF